MRVINPSVEIMRAGMETNHCTPEQFIERVGRTCYKSEDKITDASAAKFVSGLVKRDHEAMIEHWTLIFKTSPDVYTSIFEEYNWLTENGLRSFMRRTTFGGRYIISGNMRFWRDYFKASVDKFGHISSYFHGIIDTYPLFFPEFQEYATRNIRNDILIPITVNDLIYQEEYDVHHDVTVKFICDRGVSHEIVRHRTSSFAQESTRYCNYSGDKYGKEITVVAPSWCEENSLVYENWRESCLGAQRDYFHLLDMGCTPQEARSVLPNSLKTELIMTTNLQGWKHFFDLRCAPDAHPDIQVVAKMVRNEFENLDIPGFRKEDIDD